MDSAKFWRRLRRPIISLACAQGLFVAGLAWSQVKPGDSSAAAATSDESAVALLDSFVADVQDLSAGFEQSRYDEFGEPVEEPSSGRFSLLRPDRFSWHYDAPDEVVVVADGEWLWKYEVLLEQVDKRPASELASSPAMLLGDTAAVRDNYAIAELPAVDGRRWLELTPLDATAAGFVKARLGFVDGVPVVVEFIDGLNELTRVEFNGIEVNTGLTRDEFVFEPPTGVTVVTADD
jgi:outer membrane lipoprotein carrier protein